MIFVANYIYNHFSKNLMKMGYALITALLLGSCASTQKYNSNNNKLSEPQYQQLIQLIKKQKGINEELPQQITERTESLDQKISEENTDLISPTNIHDFLRQNYGEETMAQLSVSPRYEEILTSLEAVSNYQEVIPLLYEDLSLQLERVYYGGMKDKKPSTAERLAFLSLIPKIQNNTKFVELIKKLSSLEVNLEFTESQSFLIPDAFYRIDDWQSQKNARKPEIHFSGESFIDLFLIRPDLQEFLNNPVSLDEQLEKWIQRKHNTLSLGGGFLDGSESEFNYKNLDFLQKAQQYCVMFSLNWGDLRESITQLITFDLSKNYTEEGGFVYAGEDGLLHLRHVESAAKEILPEQNPFPERLIGLTEDYLAPGEVFVLTGGMTRALTTEQAVRLTQDQINAITKRVAEVKNSEQNHHYHIYHDRLKFKNDITGLFHIHTVQVKEQGDAGPSSFVFVNPIGSDGGYRVGESDLTTALQILEYNGKHALNLVFTSVNETTFDVNLYYASGKEGSHVNYNTVNVSLGEYEKTH